MGIPSYYRKLAASVANLYCDLPAKVDWFLMDFNCLIYQVLHTLEEKTEAALIAATCEYARSIIEHVNAKNTYIALDGVVPLAKMKQQRMRRFRAVRLAEEERKLGLRSGASFDTNVITPGTAFMDRLAAALRSAIPGATISDVREAGEGEHKAMQQMRSAKTGNFVIYGLDGDLFVLAMLNQQLYAPTASIWFYREEDDGKMVCLSLERLSAAMRRQVPCLTNYALAMCLLGNDFVPQSMAFRIKDGGHERLIAMLQTLPPLIDAEKRIQWPAWMQLLRQIAATEPVDIAATIARKRKARPTFRGETATDALKAKINDRPLEWFDSGDGQLWNGELRPGWRDIYARIGLGAAAGAEATYHAAAARQYVEAIQWTFDYYVGSGAPAWDWHYAFAAAPLFEHVVAGANSAAAAVWPAVQVPTPEEQLALVLPPESYHHIPKCPERQFLVAAPEYFPRHWSYFHLGKRHFWECEAHVPMPTLRFLRSVLKK